MTAPVIHYGASFIKPFTAAEAEEIRAEDDTPPSWWRPLPDEGPSGHRHHCRPCDVTWFAPDDRPGECWNCTPATGGGPACGCDDGVCLSAGSEGCYFDSLPTEGASDG